MAARWIGPFIPMAINASPYVLLHSLPPPQTEPYLIDLIPCFALHHRMKAFAMNSSFSELLQSVIETKIYHQLMFDLLDSILFLKVLVGLSFYARRPLMEDLEVLS